jgi:hypothetical protein
MKYYIVLLLLLVLIVTACSSGDDDIRVTFDGNECTMRGPSEIPAGEYQFIWEDKSDLYPALYVGLIHEGHTYQDLLDRQGTPGKYVTKPSWVERQKRVLKAAPEGLGDSEYTATYSLKGGDNVAPTE